MARYSVPRGGYEFRDRWKYNEYRIEGDRAILTIGHKEGEPCEATIDAGKLDVVLQSAYWSVWMAKTRGLYYASGTARGEDQPIGRRKPRLFLHRIVMGCAPGDGIEVDHNNGDGLDCRVENMTRTDKAGNANNRKQQRRERQLEDVARRLLACQCGKDDCACRSYARLVLG